MNMRRKIVYMLIFTLFACYSVGQNRGNYSDSLMYVKEYSFIIKDSPPSLFTMKQFNQNYLSLYRLSVNELNKVFSPKVSELIQIGVNLFTIPLTHEEGIVQYLQQTISVQFPIRFSIKISQLT